VSRILRGMTQTTARYGLCQCPRMDTPVPAPAPVG
jgi:hypothetical protein